ncbi:MAG: methionine adenosyltransferase domain-containing protein [Acholeplasmataceae bacterium]|nr:methionine adenosyltransferase domain-containing protein [Acholeplasmataceae bacterium]
MLKTAEAVTPLHPDKICDCISDAILDACLRQDSSSRVAIETMGGHNIITITGELTTRAVVNIPEIVREVVGDDYGVQTNVVQQSSEIAWGVDGGGAGDQGIMVGYACDDNEAMIPQELYLAKNLAQFIFEINSQDGKVQVTIDDDILQTIVVSFCRVSRDELSRLVNLWLGKLNLNKPKQVYLNPAGDWNHGGFSADTGVTGRKLACDNYGPQIPIGGGAFSGKDATKVDRSGAYMARKIAVDLLKKYQAKEVLVKLAYSIGVAEPVMATAEITDFNQQKQVAIIKGYDLTPRGIINFLQLNQPQYSQVAKWGSFGQGFSWDK